MLWTECLCLPQTHILKHYQVMVLGGDHIKKWGSHGVIIRIRRGHEGGAPSMGLVSLSHESLLPLSAICHARIQAEVNCHHPEEGLHQNLTMVAPRSWTSSF